uniref:Uncharacterized protein n=1 Tax=Pyramimonas obovata TaxID=1411642 RepID=A0A7S0MRW7_9CHLO
MFYLMSEDGGTESGWQLNPDEVDMTPWGGILIRREEKAYVLDEVIAVEGSYPYRQEFHRHFAVPKDTRSDVHLMSGGLRTPDMPITAQMGLARFVGFYSESKGGVGSIEMTRQF